MKEKKKKQDKNYAKNKQPLTPEQELIAKEKQRIKNNRIKNRPIVVITYMMVAVFVSMIAYVIYFMQFKSETVIANSRNVRQDSFASTVERGDIITSDGVVIATLANEIKILTITRIMASPKITPSSSQIAENMKSLSLTGMLEAAPCVRPEPAYPPVPIAKSDWES